MGRGACTHHSLLQVPSEALLILHPSRTHKNFLVLQFWTLTSFLQLLGQHLHVLSISSIFVLKSQGKEAVVLSVEVDVSKRCILSN